MSRGKRSGKQWSKSDVSQLRNMANQNKNTVSIAKSLGRSKSAIYNKASERNISLKPKD